MNQRSTASARRQAGVGLIEVLVSIVIAMLLVLVIYQIYEISEGQKRTITAGSDAQQNAAFGLYALTRDLAVAGNGIESASAILQRCVTANLALPASRTAEEAANGFPDPLRYLVPLPVIINAVADVNQPDEITIFYGGSSSLSTPVPLTSPQNPAYQVSAPVGFSPNDVIAAVLPATSKCTLSTVDAGGVAVDAAGIATITHTPFAGDSDTGYAVGASLINLGPATAMGRVVYSVDLTTNSLRSQDQFTKTPPLTSLTTPAPLVSDVFNLKAQYGLDTDNDGVVDTWQDATSGVWTAASLPTQPIATLKQIRAVRVAIVTRSAQYEKDPITAGNPPGMPDGQLGLFCNPAPTCVYTMTLSTDNQHYRYKILETIVPLRNALWNPS
jgi:type IV pilus assembly protein PilW